MQLNPYERLPHRITFEGNSREQFSARVDVQVDSNRRLDIKVKACGFILCYIYYDGNYRSYVARPASNVPHDYPHRGIRLATEDELGNINNFRYLGTMIRHIFPTNREVHYRQLNHMTAHIVEKALVVMYKDAPICAIDFSGGLDNTVGVSIPVDVPIVNPFSNRVEGDQVWMLEDSRRV